LIKKQEKNNHHEENNNIAFEDQLTKDYYREKAQLKCLNYENLRKSITPPQNTRKEISDYYNMNERLVKDFIYDNE